LSSQEIISSTATILRTCSALCRHCFWAPRLALALLHPMLPRTRQSAASLSVPLARYVELRHSHCHQFDALGARRDEVEVKLFGGGDVLVMTPNLKWPPWAAQQRVAIKVLEEEGFSVVASSWEANRRHITSIQNPEKCCCSATLIGLVSRQRGACTRHRLYAAKRRETSMNTRKIASSSSTIRRGPANAQRRAPVRSSDRSHRDGRRSFVAADASRADTRCHYSGYRMPRMDGLTFLKKLMSRIPSRRLCSSLAEGAKAHQGFEYGASTSSQAGLAPAILESPCRRFVKPSSRSPARSYAHAQHTVEPKLTADCHLSPATHAMQRH